MANTTDAAAPASTTDPVIAWLERIRDFVASSPESKQHAQQAIDKLSVAGTMLQALREVAGDYLYLDPNTRQEQCVHCLEDEGKHDPECTMHFVFEALQKADGIESR